MFKKDISDFISNKEKTTQQSKSAPALKRMNLLKYEAVYRELMAFADKIEIKGDFITDYLLIKKDEKIAKEYNLEDFKTSLAWLYKFKN